METRALTERPDTGTAPLTCAVAEYVATAATRTHSHDVEDRAKMHIADAMVAIISGARLRPGKLAVQYAARRGVPGRASLAGTLVTTIPELAAFANGMCAHADESDDGSDVARFHPAASIIPATFALAEERGVTGRTFLAAVIAGYNVGAAINLAAWGSADGQDTPIQSTHGLGQLFGAAAAGAAVSGLSHQQVRYVLSYCAQKASGVLTFLRDREHVEKAFAMGGKQAHDAVFAVSLVEAGFSGVDDVLDGSPNLFDVWGSQRDAHALVGALELRDEILDCDIKLHPVGMPLQAVVEAVGALCEAHTFRAGTVERVICYLPRAKMHVVDAKSMPDVNCQYIVAVMLCDGSLTFAAAHDYERFRDDQTVQELMRRVVLAPHDEAAGESAALPPRGAMVAIELADGTRLLQRVAIPRGNHRNPASWPDVAAKAHHLLAGLLPSERISDMISRIAAIETLENIRDLRDVLVA